MEGYSQKQLRIKDTVRNLEENQDTVMIMKRYNDINKNREVSKDKDSNIQIIKDVLI